jgi:hypothetical protein
MKIETATLLKQAADDIGVELELRDDYSGRCMYGATTAAIIGTTTDIIKATAAAAGQLGIMVERADHEGGADENHAAQQAMDEFMMDLDWSRDSMGMMDIVVY